MEGIIAQALRSFKGHVVEVPLYIPPREVSDTSGGMTGGDSLLSLSIFYEGGGERALVTGADVPVLKPGEDHFFTFDLTCPREPVRLIAQVDGVQGEVNPDDNERSIPLGTPAPTDVYCQVVAAPKGPAVRLRLKDAGLYDQVLVYRDCQLLGPLPGSATSHVDTGAALLPSDGILGGKRGRFCPAPSISTTSTAPRAGGRSTSGRRCPGARAQSTSRRSRPSLKR